MFLQLERAQRHPRGDEGVGDRRSQDRHALELKALSQQQARGAAQPKGELEAAPLEALAPAPLGGDPRTQARRERVGGRKCGVGVALGHGCFERERGTGRRLEGEDLLADVDQQRRAHGAGLAVRGSSELHLGVNTWQTGRSWNEGLSVQL